MKKPFRRLRGFGHHHHHRDRKAPNPAPAKLDELADAAKDVEEMTTCYDGLLSAAAAATNSVYEFAEALEEMGTCLLAKTALNDDDDESGRALMMLGKAQYELQKSADSYRKNIIHTITTPSESLLKELQILEEMKYQCDTKRKAYEEMRESYRNKGRSRHSNIEPFPTELQASFHEYQEDAALFIFRLKSLKQAQFHSMLTQAARHHASQLSFFRRGLKCLEALEPRVKAIAEKHHIDYQFSGLEEDGSDNDGYSSYGDTCSDDEELSFNYEINDRDQDLLPSTGSMDLDKREVPTSPAPLKESNQEEVVPPQLKPEFVTRSAPIFADNLPDRTDTLRQMRPSSSRFSYILPTPAGDKNPKPAGSHRSHHSEQFFERKPHATTNSWHSSPLMKDYKASTMQIGPIRLPSRTEFKKFDGGSWSGPIPSKPVSQKSPNTMGYPTVMPAKSVARLRTLSTSVSPKLSPKLSPLPALSPKISELHFLPLPPEPPRPCGLVGYSGPLVSKRQAPTAPTRASPTASQTASPLPRPPAVLARSYSIPSNSQRTPIITVNKLLEARQGREGGEVSSPPLTPLALPAKSAMGSNVSSPPLTPLALATNSTTGNTRKETL